MGSITIIGAGLAGLAAATELAKQNIPCCLVSPQPSERAQSVLAEGGINAALDIMGEGDSVAEHYADTMRGGVYLADPNAVAGLTAHAPDIVRHLCAIGVPFQMENGRMIQRSFGGQKKKRTAYAKSSTGKALMTAMIDEARKYEASGLIRRYPRHELYELVLADGVCRGAVVRDTFSETLLSLPGPVILAMGGFNGLFPGMTTGTTQNTGDALAIAFSEGVELANLEFIQYHPTTAAITGKRLLISEAARGEGGRLFVRCGGTPWYFMEELYPELGNLMPRDVISREMTRVCAMPDCEGQAYLDLTGLPRETWRRRLPDMRGEIRHYLAIDPVKTPVPVGPGIHFFMGGIFTDERHRTSVPGLFAAGECACQYHGANRLGGNSLLGALYGGVTAAHSAAEASISAPLREEPLGTLSEKEARQLHSSPALSNALGAALRRGLDIMREETGMQKALDDVGALAEGERTEMDRRRLALGRAMLLSALARKESRGAHTRTDFPERDDENFQKTTIAVYRDGETEISFRDIPERRAHGDTV